MLTDKLRPLSWSDMAGQDINKQILKAIIKNPEKAPKSLILEGVFGSGKTTSARILARELNGIKDPNYDLNSCPFYSEYDSTVIGNVDEIRKLRDVIGYGYGDYWNVVVFDEVHAVSQQAQTALLKVLEEVRTKTFFVLCTTHVHKVLPTIRSRSLELKFDCVSSDDIIKHLGSVEEKLSIKVPDDIKEIIASRSGGHMRNAHMLLDKYLMIGEEVFKSSVKSSINLFCDYFIAVRSNNQEIIMKSLNELCTIPLVDLKNDMADMAMLVMKSFSGLPVSSKEIGKLTKTYGEDSIKIVKLYFQDWVKNIFESNYHFQAGMLCFYSMLLSDTNKSVVNNEVGGSGNPADLRSRSVNNR